MPSTPPAETFPAHTPAASQIFTTVLTHGPLTRQEAARRTGLSPAAVTKAVRPLIEAGFLVEDAGAETRPALGRPANPVRVDGGRALFIGLKATGDEIIGVLTDLCCRIRVARRVPLTGRAPREVLPVAADLVRELLTEAEGFGVQVLGLGIAVAGDVDRAAGTVRFSPFLDWHDVPTRSEFELYQQQFRSMNIECVIDDPRNVEYTGGKLIVQGAPADVIYKRVLITELVEQCGLESAVVRAVRERAVCMVDGFRCKILHQKASLAVLSDEANADMFPHDEKLAIAGSIPWTRVVSERTTTWRGAAVDLVRLILDQRDRLVLKPNDDYGGKGITLGWTVDGATWEAAVKQALESPHIVQERVEIPSESYPSWVDGRVEFADRQYDTAPFITNASHMEGLLTRLATSPLLNVTAGGGSTVPTFIARPR